MTPVICLDGIAVRFDPAGAKIRKRSGGPRRGRLAGESSRSSAGRGWAVVLFPLVWGRCIPGRRGGPRHGPAARSRNRPGRARDSCRGPAARPPGRRFPRLPSAGRRPGPWDRRKNGERASRSWAQLSWGRVSGVAAIGLGLAKSIESKPSASKNSANFSFWAGLPALFFRLERRAARPGTPRDFPALVR